MKRFLYGLFALLLVIGQVHAGSITLLGAGRAGVAAPTPDIDLNLAAGTVAGSWASFAACLTTTNASTTYVKNSDGSLSSISANTLRLGTNTGLLVESAATNLVLRSQEFDNASWNPVSGFAAVTITANNIAGPDGTTTAELIVDNATSLSNYGRQSNATFAISSSTTYTYSIFVKYRDYQYVQLNLVTAPTNRVGYFDVQNCTTTGTPSNIVSQTTESFTSGWCRLILVATSGGAETTAKATFAYTNVNNSSGHTGVVGTGTYFWGAQVETGSTASSYYPTTTAAATRALDDVVVAGALATLLGQSTATIVAETSSSRQSVAATLLDANAVVLLGKTSGNVGTTDVGATLSTANTDTWTGSSILGLAWNGSGGIIQLDGGSTASDATARTPASTFHVGSTSGSSAFFNGYFGRIRGYNSKLASPQ